MGIAGVALGAAALWGANADPVLEEQPTQRYETFTQADYHAFDRDFDHDGRTCAVGMKRKGLCFLASPLEQALKVGDVVPGRLPDMPAEFPVIVKTDLKADGLQTWRFGRSLFLVSKDTRTVVDMMDLTAPCSETGTAMLAAVETDVKAQ